ncbi:acyl carrier protein [Streptomyces sp. URMC 123]|uniref:acyl carrier protein n=1 Tax=Streptomyces sp. URMC 123 TaxID=3423403 RepID=UPI003F1BBBE2
MTDDRTASPRTAHQPGPVRAVVTQEWIEALGLPPGREPRGDEDFFEAGGNSMQAIVMLDRIGDRLGVDPSVEALYLDGTLDALVEHCRDAVGDGPSTAAPDGLPTAVADGGRELGQR